MRRAARRDENEAAIVEALRAVGAAVEPLSGKGVPDLLVSYLGNLFLLEVKNPEAKGGGKYNTGDGCLTKDQTTWWRRWAQDGGVLPSVVFSPDDALRAIGFTIVRLKSNGSVVG